MRATAPVLALGNQRWSMDFVHDQPATGRRFRAAKWLLSEAFHQPLIIGDRWPPAQIASEAERNR